MTAFALGSEVRDLLKDPENPDLLKKGQKYYIKVRAYKLDSKGGKVYGKYSKAKTVIIRK